MKEKQDSFANRVPCSSRQSGTEAEKTGIRRSMYPALGPSLYRASIDINWQMPTDAVKRK
ncbi:hypothetical protein [Pseudoduganella namucuonensis]|uniref:hypothetical protein n=1 Tax=Pseudoduganella namucuonensis TaxID=1035707 RepID=UPI0011606D7E|nr:hypothetical protein [Pseudoduganella namucuonensis]